MSTANVIPLGPVPAHRIINSRTPIAPRPARVRFGPFELDEPNALLLRDGQPVTLPPRPFAVLCALARTPGRLVTKNDLLESVWGHCFVTESALKTAISEVRAALDDDSKHPHHIETVSRRGYRFIGADVSASPEPATASEQRAATSRDHPSVSALKALCLGDQALADLIRAVAAAL